MTTTELHVSSRGSDANPGTADKPFATPERARDELRRRKTSGGGVVVIHGGVYHRDHTFELTAEDSGTAGSPIVYRAAVGEQPRFIGGRVIPQFTRVTDADVLARLQPAARDNVVQADLKSVGVGELGAMQSRGFSRKIVPSHIELFFNAEPMTLARWPNTGEFIRITDFPRGTGKDDGHGTKMGPIEGGFFYDSLRPRRWKEDDDIWVHGYWAYDWANSYERIASIDKEAGFVKTDPPHALYGIHTGQRIYFLNVLEELDSPGEYYVDRQRGLLYFWPPSDPSKAEVTLSLLDTPMVSMDGVSHVILQGVTLECTRGHAVTIKEGSHGLIAGCTIRNTGNYGVWVEGGTHHGVQSCDIYNTGDGGVSLTGGDHKTLIPCHHFVDNCRFHHQARWSRCYYPAVIMTGVGTRVTHNLIHDHPHCAILFSGNDHLMEFNHIHHTCHETGDVGAIYTGRDWSFQGNVIRHNYMHDINGPGHLGAMAVYLDDCVSGISVIGNIIVNTQIGTLLGGGRDCVIDNNIYINAGFAVHVDNRGVSPAPVWQNMVNGFMKDRLMDVKHHEPPYSVRFPQLKTLDKYLAAGKGVPPENNPVERNLFVSGVGIKHGWTSDGTAVADRDNWTGQPGFVDEKHPEKAGFALRPDAPALRTGFQPIPFEKIGLYRDEYRTTVD
ncbi:MAG: right-handed parallel beta-helix repeat-containing protein [Planctomycetes bacterium]|nr:right-handed parallel beta-helix repeat-containing protein [Planctomycetota bacterium]